MLGGTLAGLYSSLWPKAGPPLGSDQAVQGFVQLGLENLQGQRLHNLTNLTTCSTAWLPLQWQKFSLYPAWNFLFKFHLLSPVLPTRHHCEGPDSVFWITSFCILEGPPKAVSSPGWTLPAHLPQHLITGHVLQLPQPQNLPQFINVFLLLVNSK